MKSLHLQKIFTPSVLAAAIALSSSAYGDYDDAGTDYTEAPQRSHLWNEALSPVELVNSILCFTAQMRAEEFVNAGAYSVLADESLCFTEDSEDGSQSSGASNTPSYSTAIINAVQEDDDSPLTVSVWLPSMQVGDGDGAIKFKATITEGADDENPFGQFTFNYAFFSDIADTEAIGGGEVKTIDEEGKIGFTLYEEDPRYSQTASVVMNEDRSEGIALTSNSHQEHSAAFALAFNEDNVLLQKGQSYDTLGYVNNDQDGTCLSRTNIIETVHRYNVFDAESGDAVEIDSGFSFKYDSDNDGTDDSYGHIGYWGIWTESGNGLDNGTEITLDNHDGQDSGESYTVVTTPGRLIKKSIETLNLSDADGISFSYWSDIAQEAGYDDLVVSYLTTDDGVEADGFYVTHGRNWGENGETLTEIDETLISLSDNEVLYLHSNQLGGQVQYKAGDTAFSFFKETFMTGTETAEGELFAASSATLHCVDRCPIGELGASDLSDFDSPFVSGVNGSLDNAVAYTISNTGASALALTRSSNSEVVMYEEGLSESELQNTPHSWGLQSGAMVTTAALAEMSNPWDIYDPEIVTEFYVWETGPNDWNKVTTVQDSEGEYLSFDRPLQFAYQHSDAKDRTGDAGDYDGATYMLNYGGNGDLWGLPFEQEEETGRHFAVFNLADGATLGTNDAYVVKAADIEGTMAAANGECDDLSIEEPEVAVPSSIEGGVDIGTMPVITDDPKAIAGVLVEEEEDDTEDESSETDEDDEEV